MSIKIPSSLFHRPPVLSSLLLLIGLVAHGCEGSRVLELSDRFLDVLKEQKLHGFGNTGVSWLVKFYAPWCGHCKKLEPIYAHVAQQIHTIQQGQSNTVGNTVLKVARVDCSRFPNVAKEFGVQGFPTIAFFRTDTSFHIYEGPRDTATPIVQYARRMMGPSIKTLDRSSSSFTTDSPTDSISIIPDPYLLLIKSNTKAKENKVADDDDDHLLLLKAFSDQAKLYQPHIDFYITEEEEGFSPGVYIFYPSSDNITSSGLSPFFLKYNPETSPDLASFIDTHRFPIIAALTPHNLHDLVKSKKLLAIAIVEEDKLGRISNEDEAKFLGLAEEFAQENWEGMRHDVQWAYTPTPAMGEHLALQSLPLPSLLILNASSWEYYIYPEMELDKDLLLEYLGRVVRGEVRPSGGGTGWGTRLYRIWYEVLTQLVSMFQGNPVLTTVLFGLPLGFLSLICYSICCSDIMDANEEDVDYPHEKNE